MRTRTAAIAWLIPACLLTAAAAAPPTDNPIRSYYQAPQGYPAWTDEIRWDSVIDMSAYAKGESQFDRFENARDELAKLGGGVLYYPAGEYVFDEGPFDGPRGRGLMLRAGVVIRGEAPDGKPLAARDGALGLGTRFVFGTQARAGHKVPRDWNLVGLRPEAGEGLADVQRTGIAWVRIEGAVVFFGPELKWGDTWATAKSWKSAYAKKDWKSRKPDGTHPYDPFMGAPSPQNGGGYVGGGSKRFVFGCELHRAALLNDFETCGRREAPEGFGEDGFHMAKFAARVAVYGSRVLVANNALLRSEEGNFLYTQTTVPTGPNHARGGNAYRIGKPRETTVMWDYNRVMGVDVNKDFVSMVRGEVLKSRLGGYFEEGVIVRDNWVFNHGHKSFNVSGRWLTVHNNTCDRLTLRGGAPVLGVEGGWRLTLDGFIESSAGGGGMISDNLSRAFDLAGEQLWVDHNVYGHTGSSPGNDGEGILCQAHGGTHITSWACTYNRKLPGTSGGGYVGGYNVRVRGALMAWNECQSYVGALMSSDLSDFAIVCNRVPAVQPTLANVQAKNLQKRVLLVPEGHPLRPELEAVEVHGGDAVRIRWRDCSGVEPPQDERGRPKRPGREAVREIGFRVDRSIDGGEWSAVAYRPPQMQGLEQNPPEWIDFCAPRERELRYRVVALSADDTGRGAGRPSEKVVLGPPHAE